jgi:glycosyltransferase involved in cell wall biosynthesis
MRILHVAPFYEPAWALGGMVRAASGLCRALAARGHDVTVVTARPGASDPAEEVEGGVRILRFEGPVALARRLFPWAPGLSRSLAGLLGDIQIVHVHGHRNGLAVSAVRACRRARVPFVLQPHGTFPEHGQHALEKRIFDRVVGERIVAQAAALIAVSDAEAAELPRPAQVIGNGVTMPEPGRVSRRPRSLLFVGSGARQKRSQDLPALLLALPSTRLEVVGPVAEDFARAFGDEAGRVTLRGVLDHRALARAYASARLVVHPAAGEAFGLVPFEAALCGTASVVVGGHGCGEWFSRAGGCVVPPDDPTALAREAERRLSAPAVAEAEARAVARFTRANLTWERAAGLVEGVYRRALAGPVLAAP